MITNPGKSFYLEIWFQYYPRISFRWVSFSFRKVPNWAYALIKNGLLQSQLPDGRKFKAIVAFSCGVQPFSLYIVFNLYIIPDIYPLAHRLDSLASINFSLRRSVLIFSPVKFQAALNISKVHI